MGCVVWATERRRHFLTGNSDYHPSIAPSGMGALVFPWLMCGITYKEAPSTSEVLKPISRTEGKRSFICKE